MGEQELDIESREKLGAPVLEDETGAVYKAKFTYGDSLYAKLQRFAGRLGVEQRGIERVPEAERTDTNIKKIATMFCSANMAVACIGVGALGRIVYYIGFVDGILTIFFMNALAILPVCWWCTFGPYFGFRQMVLSRYYFGYYGTKFIAFINILSCIGWGVGGTMVGAQLINTVNPDFPGYAGVIIVAACVFVVTVFGYRVIRAYEGWSWIPTFIILMIVLGQFAHTGAFQNIPMGTGSSEIGGVLSFSALIFGNANGWVSFAADYSVYQPANTSRLKCSLWTFLGLIFPLLFIEMLGLALATAYVEGADDTNLYTAGYDAGSIGGLLGAVLIPPFGRFGRFCLVVLALSTVANASPNVYSLSFSLQVMARWTQAVPRFVWNTFAMIICVAIAIPGYSHFATYLSDFLSIMAYWVAIYQGIALPEHFLFKRGIQHYDVSIYQKAGKLPPGIAAISAFLFGILGAVMGMSQVWFIGPIAILVGVPPFGGDIGFELAFCFSMITYIPFRMIELRAFGR